jgi:hypothetical protein
VQAIIVHQTRLVLGPVDALDVDPVLEHFPKRRHLSQSEKKMISECQKVIFILQKINLVFQSFVKRIDSLKRFKKFKSTAWQARVTLSYGK